MAIRQKPLKSGTLSIVEDPNSKRLVLAKSVTSGWIGKTIFFIVMLVSIAVILWGSESLSNLFRLPKHIALMLSPIPLIVVLFISIFLENRILRFFSEKNMKKFRSIRYNINFDEYFKGLSQTRIWSVMKMEVVVERKDHPDVMEPFAENVLKKIARLDSAIWSENLLTMKSRNLSTKIVSTPNFGRLGGVRTPPPQFSNAPVHKLVKKILDKVIPQLNAKFGVASINIKIARPNEE